MTLDFPNLPFGSLQSTSTARSGGAVDVSEKSRGRQELGCL